MIQYQLADYLFQGNSNITGYPSAEGDALAVHIPSNLFAINKNSKHKEECWRFIKTLFERNIFGSGFPVDNDSLEAYLLESATPNMTEDENGTMVEMPSHVNMIDFTVDLYALTDSQVKAIRELTASDMMLMPEEDNSKVYNIVKEEVEAFFQGKKTAEEVCSVIQSRVNIYLSENK